MKKLLYLLLCLSVTLSAAACTDSSDGSGTMITAESSDSHVNTAADTQAPASPLSDLPDDYDSVYIRLSGSTEYLEPIKERYYPTVDSIINSVRAAPTRQRTKDDSLLCEAILRFIVNGEYAFYVNFYSDGLVTVGDSMGASSAIAAMLDADTYASHMEALRSMVFDPKAFAELIPNESMTVSFHHQIFVSSVHLYFCTSRTDARDFAVYYTNDYGDTVGMLNIEMPPLEYDSAVPVCAGGGGGSGECEFIVRLCSGDTVTYVSYNNFAYTDDVTEFAYGGEVTGEHLEWLMSQYPDAFAERDA